MSQDETTRAPFVILFVCSGNICRSPMAQRILEARLGANNRFEVLSAGTLAIAGHAMSDEAALMVTRFGGDPSSHRSTPLSADLIIASDLVLTATRDHRRAVVSTVPRASRYTFTMKQFARLMTSMAPDDRDAVTAENGLVAAVAAQRGFTPPPERPELDDIDDPYLESVEVYESVAAEIDASVQVLADALRTARIGEPR
jgi:protein-tyrosine phosphatase